MHGGTGRPISTTLTRPWSVAVTGGAWWIRVALSQATTTYSQPRAVENPAFYEAASAEQAAWYDASRAASAEGVYAQVADGAGDAAADEGVYVQVLDGAGDAAATEI